MSNIIERRRPINYAEKIELHSLNSAERRIRDQAIFEALRNEKVTEFVKGTLQENYRNFFKHHEKEAQEMIEDAFQLLIVNANISKRISKFSDKADNDYIQVLNGAFTYVYNAIFQKKNPLFWFNQEYIKYKRDVRSERDFEQIEKFIKNQTVLDFGCGTNYFALKLKKEGFKVLTTDILDYRAQETKDLSFQKMANPADVPYSDEKVDTVIIKTVFHHVEDFYIPLILRNLPKSTTRLIIKEDVIQPFSSVEGLKEARSKQPRLKKYLLMDKNSQLQTLILFDFFGNAIAQGILEMSLPFNFKTVDQWKKIIETNNFKVVKTILSGFEKDKLHSSCQVWLICDAQK